MSETSSCSCSKFDNRIDRVISVALNQDAKTINHNLRMSLFQEVRKYLNHIQETGDTLEAIVTIKVQPKEDLVSGSYPCDWNAPVDGENGTENKNFSLALEQFKFVDQEKENRKIKIVKAVQDLAVHD